MECPLENNSPQILEVVKLFFQDKMTYNPTVAVPQTIRFLELTQREMITMSF